MLLDRIIKCSTYIILNSFNCTLWSFRVVRYKMLLQIVRVPFSRPLTENCGSKINLQNVENFNNLSNEDPWIPTTEG